MMRCFFRESIADERINLIETASPPPSAAWDAGDILRSAGEGLGSFLAGIPPALVEFFGSVATGAVLHGIVDWGSMILGLALLL